jgi:AcrR family transcriptional regulator
MILDMANASSDLAARIAGRTLAARNAQYADEVRRLLDAGLVVMRRCGTTSSPRVADIVEEAGLSNDAFYRHFASKQALVAAILEDGTTRLAGYVEHQMAKVATPEDQVRQWVEAVLAQAADRNAAATTLAVMWNGGTVGEVEGERPTTVAMLAPLLHEPLAALGSSEPELDAAVVAHLTIGRLSDHLWQGSAPSRKETAHLVALVLRAVSPAAGTARPVR